MKAMFVTTETCDTTNHVRAFESAFGEVEHYRFDHTGIRNDWKIIETAERVRPQAIFYIGANCAPGIPKPDTLKALRNIAPTVNLCSDAADSPWHSVLAFYRCNGCFDLQVSIDGAKDVVDLSTLTPVDSRPFDAINVERDIRSGFSGTVGRWNSRSEMVLALKWFGGLTVRDREGDGTYEDHVRFLKRCKILLNISITGSGRLHHIKGRVLEAGWAGCALLESDGSPINDWFPSDCYFLYRNPKEASDIIESISDEEILRAAKRLSEEVRKRFRPEQIYGEMLKRVGLRTSA